MAEEHTQLALILMQFSPDSNHPSPVIFITFRLV